jgi:adenylylsulfate kinase
VKLIKIILILGLPGSGKTTLAKSLYQTFINKKQKVEWFNADRIREQFNDWDFGMEGRHRQMLRMKDLAKNAVENGSYVICDFVCPTKDLRKEFGADYVIWMNTITEGRFEDTNKVFDNLDQSEYNEMISQYEWWNTQFPNYWSKKLVDNICQQNLLQP